MHQTTVRFGPDLWEALEAECARLGVSAAQYVREAALARLAYTAGRRGELEYEQALISAGAGADASRPGKADAQGSFEAGVASLTLQVARDAVKERANDSAALGAQSEQVKARARAIRARSEELRRSNGWRKD